MWRREERLEYWLAGVQLSPKPALALRLREKLSQRLRLWDFPNIVRERTLSVDSNVICLDDALSETACVKDGLGALGQGFDGSATDPPRIIESACAIRQASLLNMTVARTLKLPDAQGARIKQAQLTIIPYSRYLRMNFRTTAVRTLEYLQLQPPAVGKANSLISTNPAVRILTSQISEIPHRRASVNINTLQASEGYLHEAEILKGIPADRSELLAVFRHVPVEAISRLRYLAEEKAIVYSISNTPNVTRTRVHDMAVVRDTSNQEIHLVPHRTRYRTVFLN